MRASIAAAALLLLPQAAGAQRLMVGASGGEKFDNLTAGPTVSLELPAGKHFEVDLSGYVAPVRHAPYGWGITSSTTGQLIAWVTPRLGLTGSLEYGTYRVTRAHKEAYYTSAGIAYRLLLWGSPARLYAGWVGEVANGIAQDGTETSHLEAGHIGWSARVGCIRAGCFRSTFDFAAGRVLTQGNPQCDGTWGPVQPYCRRSTAIGGGSTLGIAWEWPRYRDDNGELF